MSILNITQIAEKDAKRIVEKLNEYLANMQVHYSNLRGYHWHVEGKPFFVLHEKFEEMYDATAERIDEVAERILMLEGTPTRFFSDIEKLSTIKQAKKAAKIEDIMDQLKEEFATLIKLEREVIDLASELGDEVTADLITGYLAEQEKMVWMFSAFNR